MHGRSVLGILCTSHILWRRMDSTNAPEYRSELRRRGARRDDETSLAGQRNRRFEGQNRSRWSEIAEDCRADCGMALGSFPKTRGGHAQARSWCEEDARRRARRGRGRLSRGLGSLRDEIELCGEDCPIHSRGCATPNSTAQKTRRNCAKARQSKKCDYEEEEKVSFETPRPDRPCRDTPRTNKLSRRLYLAPRAQKNVVDTHFNVNKDVDGIFNEQVREILGPRLPVSPVATVARGQIAAFPEEEEKREEDRRQAHLNG